MYHRGRRICIRQLLVVRRVLGMRGIAGTTVLWNQGLDPRKWARTAMQRRIRGAAGRARCAHRWWRGRAEFRDRYKMNEPGNWENSRPLHPFILTSPPRVHNRPFPVTKILRFSTYPDSDNGKALVLQWYWRRRLWAPRNPLGGSDVCALVLNPPPSRKRSQFDSLSTSSSIVLGIRAGC